MRRPTKVFYEFHDFRIDPQKRLLLRDKKEIPVSLKVFDILLLLIQNNTHIVTKEELCKEVWHGTFTTKSNIPVHVSKVRKALGQSREGHQCIETIEKQGYRFACEVREVEDEAVDPPRERQAQSVVTADEDAAPYLKELQSPSDNDVPPEATAGSQTVETQADESLSVSATSRAMRLINAIGYYKLMISAALLILFAAAFVVTSKWKAYIPNPEPEPPSLSLSNSRKITKGRPGETGLSCY